MGRKLSVMPGEQYGILTVTSERNGQKVWCRCNCGELVAVMPRDLRVGITRSCKACTPTTTKHGHKRGPLEVGDWVGALQAVEKAGKNADGYQVWEFECVCGGTRRNTATEMKRYINPSCGECTLNRVITKPFAVDFYKQKFKYFYDFAVKRGYRLYNTSVQPPELVYDPMKGEGNV